MAEIKTRKKFQTEYKVLILVLILSTIMLISFYIYRRYFSTDTRLDDYLKCTTQEIHSPLSYQKITCQLVDGHGIKTEFTYPQFLSEEKEIKKLNTAILNYIGDFKKNIETERYENYGIQYHYDYLINYKFSNKDSILFVTMKKDQYVAGVKKPTSTYETHYLNTSYELLTLKQVLKTFSLEESVVEEQLQSLIQNLYFAEFEYSSPKETAESTNSRINEYINSFGISHLSNLYVNDKGQLVGICNIPNPRVNGSYQTYYFLLENDIKYAKVAF